MIGLPTTDHLAIYLNDHLAGSTLAIELVKRAAGENAGTELGDFLADLRVEIEEDRAALTEIMSELDVSVDRAKQAVGWVAEKAGRLKLNGRLVGYSALSPLIELEALSLGVEGKRSLWAALAETHAERIGAPRLGELIERAERQRAGVERHRLAVARRALAP